MTSSQEVKMVHNDNKTKHMKIILQGKQTLTADQKHNCRESHSTQFYKSCGLCTLHSHIHSLETTANHNCTL